MSHNVKPCKEIEVHLALKMNRSTRNKIKDKLTSGSLQVS